MKFEIGKRYINNGFICRAYKGNGIIDDTNDIMLFSEGNDPEFCPMDISMDIFLRLGIPVEKYKTWMYHPESLKNIMEFPKSTVLEAMMGELENEIDEGNRNE